MFSGQRLALRERPAEELARVAEMLELDVTRKALQRAVARERFSRLPGHRTGAGHEARAAKPGAWRQNLSREERDVLDRMLGPKLAELGYEAETPAGIAA